MKVGAMNHPARLVEGEIEWIAEMGLDFIDLTLEPPGAGCWQIDVGRVRNLLRERGLGVVGHTAYYLPIAHPFEGVRRAAVAAVARCAEVFAELGAECMNIHPDGKAPMHDQAFILEQNLRSLRELLETTRRLGVKLMVENLPGEFRTVAEIGPLLESLPEIGLHLDLGHTHLAGSDPAEAFLSPFGGRLLHVHLHDNLGGSADLHLPLGAGKIDLPRSLHALKKAGYDGTITLEVFAPDAEYLRYSIRVLRRLWQEI